MVLLGAVHGVFLGFVLLRTRKGPVQANRWLGALMLVFALDLGLTFLYESRYLIMVPRAYFVSPSVNFLYGPLVYLYVRALTAPAVRRASWTHFVPFGLSCVLLTPFYLLPESQILGLAYEDAVGETGLLFALFGAVIVMFAPVIIIGVYLALSWRQLVRHRKSVRDQFSSLERVSLRWLRNLLAGVGTLYLLYVVALFWPDLFGARVETVLDAAIVLMLYAIGYQGLRQPIVFANGPDVEQPSAAEPRSDSEETQNADGEYGKYTRSALDLDTGRALLEELREHMASAKPHLDSGLTLNQLASQMGISSNYLSQVINQQTGSNFFDFINRYRVELVKAALCDPKVADRSVLAIAMDAGFNSKSAFYTAFRQHAEMTPKQFRKAHASR